MIQNHFSPYVCFPNQIFLLFLYYCFVFYTQYSDSLTTGYVGQVL